MPDRVATDRSCMNAIPAPVQQVLLARQDAANQEVQFALARKSLDVQHQTGNALNAMLQQTALAARQISEGYLDVKI